MAAKEITHFGCSGLLLTEKSIKGKLTEAEYLSYFDGVRSEKRIGESSVLYFSSETAAQEIAAFAPDALIIIMLRNPVDMLHSYYHDAVKDGNEDIMTFEEALAAETDRRQGKRIPKTTHNIGGLYYSDVIKFADQVQRYLDCFGRERVRIILFDDLRDDVVQVYRDTLTFLGVEPFFQPELKIINSSHVSRSQAFMNFLNYPSRWQSQLRSMIPRPIRSAGGRILRRLNVVYKPRPPLSPDLRKRLEKEFSPEVDKLSAVLERDLSAWYQT